MTSLLQTIVDAISLGSLFALSALGIGLLFGVLRVVNFAHGNFIAVGAFALIVPSTQASARLAIGLLPTPFLIVSVVGVVVAVAFAAELLVFRPLRGANAGTLMIATFSLGFMIQSVMLMLYSSRPKSVNFWSDLNSPVMVTGVRLPLLQLVTIATTILLLLLLTLFLKYVRFGVQMRAAAEDLLMARFLGIRSNRVIGTAVGLSGALAAVVSLLLTANSGVLSYQMGLAPMLFAFIGTVIGGMGSILGAVTGGFVVGVLSVLLQAFLPDSLRPFRDTFLFTLVVAILLLRPQGIVGRAAWRNRV